MIIDAFTFFNELDLLEVRLNELNNAVDYFVLVEASKTQSLIPKPFYFEENRKRFDKFLHKIIHVKVNDCPSNNGNLWAMENFQRDCITRGVSQLDLKDSDHVMISDVDEIPSGEILGKPTIPLMEDGHIDLFSIEMGFYAYYMNLRAVRRNWIGTIVASGKIFKESSPQLLRGVKDQVRGIRNGGWHLSWLGGYQRIHQKALSCIEPFDKSTLPTEQQFKEHFEKFKQSEQKFFIHLENLSRNETEFGFVDTGELPEYVQNNLMKFRGYLL